MVLPFQFVNWNGCWYAQGCRLKRSASAWKADLWIPALRKRCISISSPVTHYGMKQQVPSLGAFLSPITFALMTDLFDILEIFLWLASFFTAWKMLCSRCVGPLQIDCTDCIRYILVCCFLPWVIKLLWYIKPFVLPEEKQHLACKWKVEAPCQRVA